MYCIPVHPGEWWSVSLSDRPSVPVSAEVVLQLSTQSFIKEPVPTVVESVLEFPSLLALKHNKISSSERPIASIVGEAYGLTPFGRSFATCPISGHWMYKPWNAFTACTTLKVTL